MERGRLLLSSRPAFMYQLIDNERYFKAIATVFSAAFAAGIGDKGLMERLRPHMPTDSEWEKVFGVGASQAYLTDEGLVLENVQVLGGVE